MRKSSDLKELELYLLLLMCYRFGVDEEVQGDEQD